MHLPRAFRSLGVRNFRLFWAGQLVSLCGTWMQTVGQAWLVLDLTGSPLALGTVTALQFTPVLLFSLFAGVFVDRLPKRRLLVFTQITAMLQALTLAILISTGLVQLWHVYVLATILGLVNALDNPTRQSFVMELVGRDEIVNAVALNSMTFNGARIVGPAIGGFLIGTVGLATSFYANAFSFVAALASLRLMSAEQLRLSQTKPSGRLFAQLAEGLKYVTRTPAVLAIVIAMGTLGTFGYNFATAFPLLARNVLDAGPEGLGSMFSAMGVGSLTAGFMIANLQQPSSRRLFIGAGVFVLVLEIIAVSSWYPLTLALMLPLGFASITFNTSANVMLQLQAPDHMRGRVMGVYTLLFMGTTPIGGLVTGILASRWGVQWALGIEAVVCLLGIVTALGYKRAMA